MSFNPFEGMRNAETSQSGTWFATGRYKVKIAKLIWKKLNAGGEALIVETTVLESSNDKTPVGASRTWLQKNNKSFKAAAKLFCFAACGYDIRNEEHDKIIKAQIEPNCETIMLKALNEGLLTGREVYVEVTEKPKQSNPGEMFSLHTFSPAQPPIG